MTDKIIVFNEKHGDSYYDASTPEAINAACLEVLRQRFQMNWYYEPAAPQSGLTKDQLAVLELTDEQIESLPASIRGTTKRSKDSLKVTLARNQAGYKNDKEWYDLLVHLVSLPKDEALAETVRNTGAAYWLISQRSDGEYEDFDIVTVRKA